MQTAELEFAIKEEFLEEAQELIEDCEAAFLELEQNPGDNALVARIFRNVHTLKGSGYTAGFDQFGSFAHKFEALLSKVRDGEIDVSESVVNTMLLANDLLKQYIQELQDDCDAVVDTQECEGQIAAEMGSSMPAEVSAAPSEDGEGGGFGFFDDEDDEPTVVTKSEPKQASPNKAGLVLICDDDCDILEVISDSIDDLGAKHLTASDGVQGLDVLDKNDRIDVVITDLKMPNMDGLSFVREIRKKDRTIPVIVISGFADRGHLAEFLNLGIFGFVEKPFDTADLESTVNAALKMRKFETGVVELSRLNFRSHMSVSKILQYLDSGDQQQASQERQRLDELLEQISHLTHDLLAC